MQHRAIVRQGKWRRNAHDVTTTSSSPAMSANVMQEKVKHAAPRHAQRGTHKQSACAKTHTHINGGREEGYSATSSCSAYADILVNSW